MTNLIIRYIWKKINLLINEYITKIYKKFISIIYKYEYYMLVSKISPKSIPIYDKYYLYYSKEDIQKIIHICANMEYITRIIKYYSYILLYKKFNNLLTNHSKILQKKNIYKIYKINHKKYL